jgi:AcrR family transcriptional regulator
MSTTRRTSARRRPARPAPGETRLILVRAAEKLFARRGVDAVSLREISVAAGQHNNSAVTYHFGSREGLIDAVLERHSRPILARYDEVLDLLERRGRSDLRTLVETLTQPIVAKIDDPDGGWEYLSIAAQLSVRPYRPLTERPVAQTPAVTRLIAALAPYLRTPPGLLPFRLDRIPITIYASVLAWHRLEQQGLNAFPRGEFEQDLCDTLVNLITQPIRR